MRNRLVIDIAGAVVDMVVCVRGPASRCMRMGAAAKSAWKRRVPCMIPMRDESEDVLRRANPLPYSGPASPSFPMQHGSRVDLASVEQSMLPAHAARGMRPETKFRFDVISGSLGKAR